MGLEEVSRLDAGSDFGLLGVEMVLGVGLEVALDESAGSGCECECSKWFWI